MGAAETRAVSPELRAEGVARLEQLVKVHPEILRARFVLAEALAHAGRVEPALAALDALVAMNGAHEDARALREELKAQVAHPTREATERRPAPGAPPPQPRNESSHALPDQRAERRRGPPQRVLVRAHVIIPAEAAWLGPC